MKIEIDKVHECIAFRNYNRDIHLSHKNSYTYKIFFE